MGFMPVKEIMPKVYGGRLEEWRNWKDDMEDYADTVKPGMKEVMKEVEGEKDPINKGWRSLANQELREKQYLALWRLLKGRTEEEARKVISAAEEGAGYAAWQTL